MSRVAIIFIVIIMVAAGIIYSIEDSQRKILNQSNGIEVFLINHEDYIATSTVSSEITLGEMGENKDLESPYKLLKLKIKNKVFKTELSDTTKLQMLGLSGRGSIGENEAMLFAFEESAIHSFWMKDMNFPIDMIWINDQKKIIHIEKRVSPDSFPQSYQSDTPAKYVLEVQSGISDKNNFSIGDTVDF